MTDQDNVVPLTRSRAQSTEEMNERVEQARLARQSALGVAVNAHDRYTQVLAIQRAVSRREKGEADMNYSQEQGFVEIFHRATMTKAPMLENAVPGDSMIRDGVKADRQDYTILVIGLALGAAALIAWIA